MMFTMEKNVIVVGAGLAGMVAAYMAQKEGAKVLSFKSRQQLYIVYKNHKY